MAESDVAVRTAPPMEHDSRIFVAGHRGLVGSAIVRRLEADGYTNVITATRKELDLRDQSDVNTWFAEHRPEYVFLVAGTVGGVFANATRPAEFIYDNLMIHGTVVHAAFLNDARKLLYLGSSCIYPRLANQPMSEDELLAGPLEPTNEPYAIAKIAGIKLCEAYRRQYGCDFVSAMPTNLYGPNDNFDLASSHLLPALIRKFHEAKVDGRSEVEVWGTGTPMRELLHVDDLADACVHLMQRYSEMQHINVGTGEDLTLREIADLVRSIVYPEATLRFDPSKPDGTPRKVVDIARLRATGWRPRIALAEGIRDTYQWYLDQQASGAELRGHGAR